MADIDEKYLTILDRPDFRRWLRDIVKAAGIDPIQMRTVPIRYPLFAYYLYADMYKTTEAPLEEDFVYLVRNKLIDITGGTMVVYLDDTIPIDEYILLLRDSLETIDVPSVEYALDGRIYLNELNKLQDIYITPDIEVTFNPGLADTVQVDYIPAFGREVRIFHNNRV